MHQSNTLNTGRASQDKPWLKFYPQEILDNLEVQEMSLKDYLLANAPSMDTAAIHFYGTDITWQEIFDNADKTARSLRALGFGEGDEIPTFLRLTPEFVYLLLAAEKIGASVLCRDNTIEENVAAVNQAGSKVIFVHDFLSQKDFNAYRRGSNTQRAVVLSPYHSASYTAMPEHVQDYIDSLYPDNPVHSPRTMDWDEFIALGDEFEGTVEAEENIRRPLLKCYTSGSTGPSKQVIHSAYTMIGNLHQMNFYGSSDQFRPTWLVTQLPPSLVAVVVAMTLMPLASNKLLIMDPFVAPEDVDLEVMRYRPNCWPSIPMFVEILMRNGRIPEDYDMSHLFSVGVGCEAYNNNQMKRAQKFLDDHGSPAKLTTGYGSSEAGSNICLHMDNRPMGNGMVGVPMPLSNMGVFRPGTTEELGYNELGEICVSGPGNMLGYDDKKNTDRALKRHKDGELWLHTGDIGYVDEDGIFYTLTRGSAPRYGFKNQELATLPMENRLADAQIEGIKDEFFVITPDPDHNHHFLPYLYVILEDGYKLSDVEDKINEALDPFMQPVEINVLPERPFWHFKTNRIGLTEALRKDNFES